MSTGSASASSAAATSAARSRPTWSQDGHHVSVHDADARAAAAAGRAGRAERRILPAEWPSGARSPSRRCRRPRSWRRWPAEWLGGRRSRIGAGRPQHQRAGARCARWASGSPPPAATCSRRPLTGGAPGAQARMLVFMVGGDDAVFERVRAAARHARPRHLPPRAARARQHREAGEQPARLHRRPARSLEVLAVAAKAGIDLRTMIDVVRAGGAGNFFTDRMVEGINERGRPTMFALSLAAKDAGLLLDVARDAGVPVPVAAQVAQSLVAAVGAGLGEHDFTDLVELIERQAQREAPPRAAARLSRRRLVDAAALLRAVAGRARHRGGGRSAMSLARCRGSTSASTGCGRSSTRGARSGRSSSSAIFIAGFFMPGPEIMLVAVGGVLFGTVLGLRLRLGGVRSSARPRPSCSCATARRPGRSVRCATASRACARSTTGWSATAS